MGSSNAQCKTRHRTLKERKKEPPILGEACVQQWTSFGPNDDDYDNWANTGRSK